MKTAILFGASGNIGAHLLNLLLTSDKYNQVKIVVRKNLPIRHPKLTTLIGDYMTLSSMEENLKADDIFITVGATDKTVERVYPVLIAKLCKQQGAKRIFIVTSVGANAKSSMAFTRIKGEIEADIINLHFNETNIFRPGMIMGRRERYRPMEKAMMRLWKIIDPLLVGKLNKYKGMEAKEIALAMYQSSLRATGSINVYHWREMKHLLKTRVTQ
ncbi:MAG TPA: NAD(P)H-binding protein [Anaerovoracaceae bacterium]|nr:NAD(P)H-binding protein [Flavobacterium sp.]HYE67468.1 NAD(P)H-binding protein [Anaerovoracaceae bacterium]